MIHLCSSSIVVEIWFGVYVGSQAFGGLTMEEFVGGVVIYSTWGICELRCVVEFVVVARCMRE